MSSRFLVLTLLLAGTGWAGAGDSGRPAWLAEELAGK